MSDQVGRLSFTQDIAAGIRHLIDNHAQYGTYNLTNSGNSNSWVDIARAVYKFTGHDPAAVRGVTTDEYFKEKSAAPRPLNSTLDLEKIASAGFVPADTARRLREYFDDR